MTRVIIAGPDRGLESALTSLEEDVTRVDGIVTGESLEAAGIENASLLLLTDAGDATAVPIAKDLNPDVRVVFYTGDSLPEFVKAQLDLLIDPDLLGPATVVEELIGGIDADAEK